MPGRPSKPVELIMIEGKAHRTNAELKHRQEAEKSLYTGEHFIESKAVKQSEIAHKEFLRLKRLYSKITYVDALDQQVINRYCLEIANQDDLQKLLDKLSARIDTDDELDTGDLIQLYKSIDGILTKIQKSKELLLKYEDRLFLNPAGRIRSIPKTPESKKEVSGMAAFLEKRRTGG